MRVNLCKFEIDLKECLVLSLLEKCHAFFFFFCPALFFVLLDSLSLPVNYLQLQILLSL